MKVKITGVTFNNADGTNRRDIIARMSENDPIRLEREPFNQYDQNAVKVCVVKNGQNQQIGYLPKNVAEIISPRMRRRESFNVHCIACGLYMDRPFCEIEIDGI